MAAIVEQIKSKNSKGKVKSALEMLLREGEEIGIKKGIKKGEEIGTRKGKLLQSLINILNLYSAFPHLSKEELVKATKQDPFHIQFLKRGLELKDKKLTWKFINGTFLKDVKLTRSEKVKITKLINEIIKKEESK